jgi:hypothetical protein
MKDDDSNPVFSELATLVAKKINWAIARRVTDPGRYMFRFGWLTITADDLAIWQAYPDGVYSDQDGNVAPGGNGRGDGWRGISSGHVRSENRVKLFSWRKMTVLCRR